MAESADGIKEEAKTVVSVEEMRETLGRYVLRAGFGNERIIVSYHGEERAVLVGLRDFERLRQLDEAAA